MEFARDPVPARAIARAVEWLADGVRTPWLLIDPVLLEAHLLRRLLESTHTTAWNALSASCLSTFDDLAPKLIRIESGVDLGSMLNAIIALDPTSPALTVIRASSDATVLFDLLSTLAMVRIDDMTVHCRFADARTLAPLLEVLNADQRPVLARGMAGWGWFDSTGKFVAESFEVDMSATSSLPGPGAPLTLEQWQFDAMLDQCEPDVMFSQLLETTPELVPHEGRGSYRHRLVQLLAQADALSVLQAPDRLQYLVLGLTLGPAFPALPVLTDTWRAVVERQENLRTIVSGWSDAMWEELGAVSEQRSQQVKAMQ